MVLGFYLRHLERCSKCKQTGHNKRTCKKPTPTNVEEDDNVADIERDDQDESIIEMDLTQGHVPTQGSQISPVIEQTTP